MRRRKSVPKAVWESTSTCLTSSARILVKTPLQQRRGWCLKRRCPHVTRATCHLGNHHNPSQASVCVCRQYVTVSHRRVFFTQLVDINCTQRKIARHMALWCCVCGSGSARVPDESRERLMAAMTTFLNKQIPTDAEKKQLVMPRALEARYTEAAKKVYFSH